MEEHRAQALLEKVEVEMAKAKSPSEKEKNPAAVALGRLGGLKGGDARAKALSKKRRSEIAKKAAQKRWAAKKD